MVKRHRYLGMSATTRTAIRADRRRCAEHWREVADDTLMWSSRVATLDSARHALAVARTVREIRAYGWRTVSADRLRYAAYIRRAIAGRPAPGDTVVVRYADGTTGRVTMPEPWAPAWTDAFIRQLAGDDLDARDHVRALFDAFRVLPYDG
jgi:hypothetical protein